jgi:fibronectin-binding autotransporter adhesin
MKKSTLEILFAFISQLTIIRKDKEQKENKPKMNVIKDRMLSAAIVIALLLVSGQLSATTYYSRAITGNWNAATSWSTVAYGNATNTGTFPVAGDIVNIGDGYTINLTGSAACATLNIGQGVSGILQFGSSANYTLTISGNVTVNTGGIFRYNTAITRTHAVNLAGNLTNFGTVDFYVAAGQVVNLLINGTGNTVVSGTGSFDMNTVTMAKSGATTAQLNIQSATFETGIRTFTGTYGTYIHNNASSFSINPLATTFTIGPNVIFQVPIGTMWFASNGDYLYLQGGLTVNGGTVVVGKTTGLQGIRTDQNGTTIPTLNVSNGTLTVYGGITYNSASAAEPFAFNMSGGTISLSSGTTGSNREVFYVTDVPNSSFTMSGGTITLQKPNTAGTLIADWGVCSTTGTMNVTGGTIQFGNASTASGTRFSFRPNGNVTFPNFKVTGTVANTITLCPSSGATSSFKLLSLYIDQGKIFDIRSISGTTGDTKTMTLMSTCNGVEALYNLGTFTARSSTVTFNTSGAQAIGGTATTIFYNLSINNSSNITLNRPAIVSNFLSMVSGKLITTNTNVLTCTSTASASIGSSLSYVDGPMVHTVASSALATRTFPIGKGSAYRPAVISVTHSSALSVTYRGEVFNSPASGLPYTLPASIANVSNVRYVKFTRQSVANFSSGTVQMYYDTDDGVTDKNSLLIAMDNGTTQWTNIGGTATANVTGNITSASISSFNSYFALGNPPGGTNPLPISLSSFTATLFKTHVDVKWTTQSEINNDYFNVERSADNISYYSIGIVDGHGTTTQMNNYSFIDNNPLRGISYYRLRQTDFDGTSETFSPVVINNRGNGIFTVYPNPSSSAVVHLSSDIQLTKASVSVQDITGKEVPFSATPQENGTMDIYIDEYYASRGGIFIISITSGTERSHQRLVIN